MTQVVDFAIKTLGMEQIASMGILLLLSSTYWQLARMEDATEPLKRVLDAYIDICSFCSFCSGSLRALRTGILESQILL